MKRCQFIAGYCQQQKKQTNNNFIHSVSIICLDTCSELFRRVFDKQWSCNPRLRIYDILFFFSAWQNQQKISKTFENLSQYSIWSVCSFKHLFIKDVFQKIHEAPQLQMVSASLYGLRLSKICITMSCSRSLKYNSQSV